MEERVSRLEGAYEQLDQRLGDIYAVLNRIDTRIDRLEAKMDARIDSLYRMMVTMMLVMVTGGIAVAGAIVTLAFRI